MAENFVYGGAPIIQAGKCYQNNTSDYGTPSDISFNTVFPNDNVYVTVTPWYCNDSNNDGTLYPMITPSVANVSSSGFQLYAWYKTGQDGQDGGGYYYGPFYFIAVCLQNPYEGNSDPSGCGHFN